MTATGLAGLEGAAPVVTVGVTERSKYERLWENPEYRAYAPGEDCAQTFLSVAKPKAGAQCIDFGSGTGRGAIMLALMGGMKVTMLDFAHNCLDDFVREALDTQKQSLSFIVADLIRGPLPASAPYGFCTDVMEHIQPECVDRVLNNILQAAQHVFFQIACTPDHFGQTIGHPLHLTVKPYAWWLEQFKKRDCVIHWSRDDGHSCMFYVSGWVTGEQVVDAGVLNIGQEKVRENVATNVKGPWKLISPHATNDLEVLLVGGGPSLAGQVDEIRALRAGGAKLVTLNGAYNFALEHGLKVSATVVVDAREFNARFTHPVMDETLYFVASQCDPAVLEGLPPERTYLWHTSTAGIKDLLDAAYGGKPWFSVPGGSTVALRAIPMLRMLGYRKFHLFGIDSCLMSDGAHHAYAQPENDSPHVINVNCGDRMFMCHPWMISQAKEFMDLVKYLGEEIELEPHGDGLISHIIRTGAELAQE